MKYLFHINLLKPLMVILGTYIYSIKVKPVKWYMHVILFVFLLLFSSLYSVEMNHSCYMLTQEEISDYEHKRDTHYYLSYYSMTCADDQLLKLFECDEKKMSQAVICAAGSAIIYKNITAAGIAAAISLVKDYLQEYYIILKKVEQFMLESKYNWEMAIFYQNILNQNEPS